MRVLLHVDMDAFFASVELLHHPEWRGKPLIVGALADERGVVSTCSYEARKFGVHSAMPSRTAYQLCPHAIFVRPRMELYQEVSRKAFEVFRSFTPVVEGVSVDEAFLDVTGALHFYPASSPAESGRLLGEALRAAVSRECSVTCSVGVAPNRLLAKIGSEQNKPDGLTVMPFDSAAATRFLAPKPVSILWGVGKKTSALLAPYGISTCAHVQKTPEEKLATILHSRSAAAIVREYAFGISDDKVCSEDIEEKSVSREYTFDVDIADVQLIRAKLLELVVDVGLRFRNSRRWARTAKIKVRDSSFRTLTRQVSFDMPSRDDISLRAAALKLFDQVFSPSDVRAGRVTPVRLIGFGVSNFTDDPADGQLSLCVDPADQQRKRRERLSEALDILRAKNLLPSVH